MKKNMTEVAIPLNALDEIFFGQLSVFLLSLSNCTDFDFQLVGLTVADVLFDSLIIF